MSLDDVFGPFEGRPQHPDFAKLVDVVLQQDGKTEDADFNFPAFLAEFLDPDSITYMAKQRAMRTVANAGKNPTLNMGLVAMVASAYIDGFTTGYKYRDNKPD